MGKRKIPELSGLLVSIVVFVVLSMPLFATIADILDGPDGDRQELTARTPRFVASPEGARRFVADLRYYIQNRYGMKDLVVSANSAVKQTLFDSMPYSDVLRGEEGFLFLGVPEALDAHQQTAPFSQADLDEWVAALRRVRGKLQAYGASYTLVIAPDKSSVYHERLPPWADVKTAHPLRSEALVERLDHAHLPAIDLLPVMLHAREATPELLYYKTDTHWNEYGASIAAEHIAAILGLEQDPETPLEPFHTHGGDLARMIGQQASLSESGMAPSVYPDLVCKHDNGERFRRNEPDPLFPLDSRLVICENAQSQSGSAIVFIDSFGVSLIPALARHFSRTVFVWQYEIDPQLILDTHAQYVIQEIAARKLQTVRPIEIVAGLKASHG